MEMTDQILFGLKADINDGRTNRKHFYTEFGIAIALITGFLLHQLNKNCLTVRLHVLRSESDLHIRISRNPKEIKIKQK